MKLHVQKRLAASVLRSSPKRIVLDNERLDDIKESITKADIKILIAQQAITLIPKRGISRGRARKIRLQKIRGKRRGHGSRKGTKNARSPRKRQWINRVRLQRKYLKSLRHTQKISKPIYRSIYVKIKGGFFRSKHHLHVYLTEQHLITKKR